MTKIIKPNTSVNPYTLESLIQGLDDRGLLVLQVLIGQQAMSILSQKHIEDVTKPSVLKPDAQDSGTTSFPTAS